MAPDEQRILITQATKGMLLARPVVLPNKVMLCARGAELNDATIARLTARGIKRLWVQGRPVRVLPHDDFPAVMKRLNERFSRVQHVPFMLSLQQVVERALIRRI